MTSAITIAQKQLKEMTTREDVQEAFKRVLGENTNAFIASMLTAVSINDRLKFCEAGSVINSAMLAASLDLPIEQNLGQAWLVPYKDKGVDKAQFQIGYKGLIQLALRSGEYKTINASVIFNGMKVKQDWKTGDVEITGDKMNDEAIGYVAYIELMSGYSHTVYMEKAEVTAHAKKYSKSWGYDSSAWTTNFDQMALKTVIRRILTKYGVLSVKMTRALTTDETPVEKMDLSDLRPNVVDAKAEEPQKKSQALRMEQLTGQKADRPWSAEYITEKIQQWTIDSEGQPAATDTQKKVLAAVLDRAMGNKTRRYELCQYLTGKASTSDMNHEATALLNWLGVTRFEEVPSDAVRKEIEQVHAAALKAAGQVEMEGMNV